MSSLVDLFHHRWALPILAELARRRGTRFVTLERTLGLNRESLRQTLAALGAAGLVRRNPGYGHPLRPEYLPTRRGEELGSAARPLVDALRRRGLEEMGLKKWSMPLVAALAGRQRRFSELREAVGASPRALTLALKELEAAELVERHVTDDYPPGTVYRLTRRGRGLAVLVEPLRGKDDLGAQPVA